jgi:DNA repair exonuclease SbcCD ATPase subunit
MDASTKEQTKIKDGHIRDIETYNGNIKYNNKCIKEREDLIETLKKEEKIIRDWTVYQELVGKNGVIKIVLKRSLPMINNEIKRTLDGLCDFDIILELNEKNEVEINMVNDGAKRPIEVGGSGFETTFAALAVRNALATISSMSSSNMLVLDEVDSTVNPDNLDALYELYHRLLSSYDYIFHVVHDDNVADLHDMVVTVVKDGHISRIES